MDQSSVLSSPMVIDCGDSLDISVMMDFKALILQALASEGEIVLDAANLERVDGAALQLLAALFNDASQAMRPIRWESPSEALVKASRLTGLDTVLHLHDAD